jgi:hypothetical protein
MNLAAMVQISKSTLTPMANPPSPLSKGGINSRGKPAACPLAYNIHSYETLNLILN